MVLVKAWSSLNCDAPFSVIVAWARAVWTNGAETAAAMIEPIGATFLGRGDNRLVKSLAQPSGAGAASGEVERGRPADVCWAAPGCSRSDAHG
jgi:hypothetical protein